MKIHVFVALGIFFLFSACNQSNSEKVYTLYRGSIMPDVKRVHVATFDAAADEQYNSENCLIAAALFRNQPGVIVQYWCEKGYYH